MCLGPLLFLLYINDIVDLFCGSVSVKLFADDIKMYTEVSDLNSCVAFQSIFDLVCEWANTWQMELSVSKCHFMRVGFCNMPSVCYTADRFALELVHSHKDLGILIDPKLSFNNHIDQVVFKVNKDLV